MFATVPKLCTKKVNTPKLQLCWTMISLLCSVQELWTIIYEVKPFIHQLGMGGS
jgi:hypothetical protein